MDSPSERRSFSPVRESGHSLFGSTSERRYRVWFGGIPPFVTNRMLIGALKDARIPPFSDLMMKKCPSRSWGFMSFRSFEEANDAIDMLHGRRLFPESDFTMEVRFANPPEPKDHTESHASFGHSSEFSKFGGNAGQNQSHRNSFMSSISLDYDALQDADASTLWHVYKDPNGVPYYYNRITGCTQWEQPVPPLLAVEGAINERNRMGSPSGTDLFIFHIPSCWTNAELAMHFTPFGNLVSAKVQKDSRGSNAGFGFVSYDNPQSAAAAVRLMKGYATNSKFLKVEYKKREGSH
ncbi:CUG-BP- and ETR-3-like factor 1 [Babesia caballi]|uniref:CUG-BP- and ETR-3-like factor 1 n=1 Tax=Babesia caballi TaxID=5871 RepID=A0AAV4M1S6_BABCB|nr:CUG-BP- and ETR-3-like factor 1 [Babesia caballi]